MQLQQEKKNKTHERNFPNEFVEFVVVVVVVVFLFFFP
jgi:hypothetical protein